MKKIPEQFICALPANKLVNPLIMRHFIKLDLTFKSVATIQDLMTNYRVLATINMHVIWSQC